MKWLKNWILVKKTWLLRKIIRWLLFIGSAAARTRALLRLGHGSHTVWTRYCRGTWSLAEDCRVSPSSISSSTWCASAMLGQMWSRPGGVRGMLMVSGRIGSRPGSFPMELGCCSGVAELVRPVTEECRWCPGKSGRCRWNWFRHFIEHLVCGFYIYFIFYFNQIKSF